MDTIDGVCTDVCSPSRPDSTALGARKGSAFADPAGLPFAEPLPFPQACGRGDTGGMRYGPRSVLQFRTSRR